MSQQESRSISEIGVAEQVDIDAPLGEFEAVRHWVARPRPTDEATVAVARELNGPLTALLLYMGEIKQHSRQLSPSAEDRAYLQKIVDNALQQTERVCALVKQIAVADEPALMTGARREDEGRSGRTGDSGRAPRATIAAAGGQRPLTKREREVLQLISEGHSNKQGALRMRISPRTFESHRAEAMRKLGARNTAELVRTALLLRIDERLD
ncbi:helix-turn-helix transcriptional regulator [Bradyrhizobium sp. Tv2a-2]|uniref:helix-turn-helix domain-containing protein n=1 Tax=Bradyrhizobium sp. Tv2a-2 TaxID=113395 RepID=UPI0003F7BF11|nr:helix-turn-helix transcriptional regulator [Bradyrhizobium sp. Tv2a-2]